MQTQTNLFARDDTFFGICQGLGDDLGFNPNWLRVALTLFLFFHPVAAIAAYFGAGILVAALRLLIPDPRPAVAPQAETAEEDETVRLAA
ncbi:PspC domain-containing protein [Sphingomonas sp. LY54]|uniref:PspC domain-containing protein n=1 Tax=Sphingomonas sp. LY54 TaxID=3095343 RepID=UPI002D7A05F2|nr:PspC domain-containing protein [Sphingomonas sp. LY54]WRP28934.1 PspC domain-containing protein [Sphingomonas sp. LY54]